MCYATGENELQKKSSRIFVFYQGKVERPRESREAYVIILCCPWPFTAYIFCFLRTLNAFSKRKFITYPRILHR